MELILHSLDTTARLGSLLAGCAQEGDLPALLLKGTLGTGKTTLVRHLITSLPHSHLAEVSSPSFTVENIYPTTPLVHHFDLYRMEFSIPEEQLLEAFENIEAVTIIEWAEFLPNYLLPIDCLICSLSLIPITGLRKAELMAHGERSQKSLQSMLSAWKNG